MKYKTGDSVIVVKDGVPDVRRGNIGTVVSAFRKGVVVDFTGNGGKVYCRYSEIKKFSDSRIDIGDLVYLACLPNQAVWPGANSYCVTHALINCVGKVIGKVTGRDGTVDYHVSWNPDDDESRVSMWCLSEWLAPYNKFGFNSDDLDDFLSEFGDK